MFPAMISKAEIAVYKALRGKVNVAPLTLGDKVHPPRSVRFLTFAGSLDVQTGLYVGHYGLEPFAGDVADASMLADLNTLPRVDGTEPTPQAAE
jgi:hypothetical protein